MHFSAIYIQFYSYILYDISHLKSLEFGIYFLRLLWQVFNRDVPVYVGQPWNRPGHLSVCGWSGLVRAPAVSSFLLLSQQDNSL